MENEIETAYEKIKAESISGGYNINPDEVFAKELVSGLLKNEQRYGYASCPCRLASGRKEEDLDIICPCDYRDADVVEFGACYCALYVSNEIAQGKKKATSIPERRPIKNERQKSNPAGNSGSILLDKLAFPVWRCKVCGYLCARDEAPEVCPICKAKKERFEKFI